MEISLRAQSMVLLQLGPTLSVFITKVNIVKGASSDLLVLFALASF